MQNMFKQFLGSCFVTDSSAFQCKLKTDKMSSLKLFFDLLSQPSRALHVIMKMSGTQFKECPVALRNAEHLTEEFKTNINRFQRVPCIIDDGFKLAESIAILRYLAARDRILPQLYPKDLMSQARVDEFLEWQHITLRITCALYFRSIWLEPLLSGNKPTPEKIASLTTHMERNLDIVEQVWLDQTDFLTGNQLTAADIFAACEIEQTRMADYDVRIKYPRIRAWLKRVRSTCNPHYDVAHQYVYKISGTGPHSKL